MRTFALGHGCKNNYRWTIKLFCRLLLLCLLSCGNLYAQSNLPACLTLGLFHNCFDTYTYASGDRYDGEWRDGTYQGKGARYVSNGSVINQGTWADDKLVSSVPVQQLTTSNSEIERLRTETLEGSKLLIACLLTVKWVKLVYMFLLGGPICNIGK